MRGILGALGLGIALATPPLMAEPFGVVDIDALLPAGGVQGPITIDGGLILFQDETGALALCDPERGRNLADLVVELQRAQTVLMACTGLSNPARADRVATLRALALPRYAERAGRPLEAVVAAFDRRAASDVARVTRCGLRPNEILRDVTNPWFETRLRDAMEADRMPAQSCPRTLR